MKAYNRTVEPTELRSWWGTKALVSFFLMCVFQCLLYSVMGRFLFNDDWASGEGIEYVAVGCMSFVLFYCWICYIIVEERREAKRLTSMLREANVKGDAELAQKLTDLLILFERDHPTVRITQSSRRSLQ